jgi:hypothetical protein
VDGQDALCTICHLCRPVAEAIRILERQRERDGEPPCIHWFSRETTYPATVACSYCGEKSALREAMAMLEVQRDNAIAKGPSWFAKWLRRRADTVEASLQRRGGPGFVAQTEIDAVKALVLLLKSAADDVEQGKAP